ncbi:MAG: hypothetical protein Q7T33_10835 [Dehalococcoidia bacterium]|nr:hypothetical protein [Dehalococcoidia bacterium]
MARGPEFRLSGLYDRVALQSNRAALGSGAGEIPASWGPLAYVIGDPYPANPADFSVYWTWGAGFGWRQVSGLTVPTIGENVNICWSPATAESYYIGLSVAIVTPPADPAYYDGYVYTCATCESFGNDVKGSAIGSDPYFGTTYGTPPDIRRWGKDLTTLDCGGYPTAPPEGWYTVKGCQCRFDRNPAAGKRRFAYVSSGALKVAQYNDASPDAVSSTVTVESANITAGGLTYRQSGVLDLLYVLSTAVKHSTSRDHGSTWSVPTTIATGYKTVTFDWHEGGGQLVAAIYISNTQTWYFTVGTLGADGVTFTWSTPATLTAGATEVADLKRRRDGVWEFVYVNTSDVVTTLNCSGLTTAGVGTWS